MIFRFENPWALLALLCPLLLWAAKRLLRKHVPKAPALPLATAALLKNLPKSARQRMQWLLPAALCAAWALFAIALARPQKGQVQTRETSQGIAIEMVLDRSGSMEAMMNFRGRGQNRLETVKEIFQDFALGGNGLTGRPNDLLGVIAFAHYPYTFCPLTLDHNALAFALKNIRLTQGATDENGTAIGDAVAMGVARLAAAEQTLAAQTKKDASAYKLKSKVIILLTDGQDEGPHTYSIAEAAELAKKHGIKVYSIAILAQQGMIANLLGVDTQYDTTEIQALARETGGLFQTCDSAKGLAEIYAKINDLEKSQIDSVRYVMQHDLYRPFLAAGFAFALLAILLKLTLCQKLTD